LGCANIIFRKSEPSESQKGTFSCFENILWNCYKHVSLKFNIMKLVQTNYLHCNMMIHFLRDSLDCGSECKGNLTFWLLRMAYWEINLGHQWHGINEASLLDLSARWRKKFQKLCCCISIQCGFFVFLFVCFVRVLSFLLFLFTF